VHFHFSRWSRIFASALLALLVVAGGALRFSHINWDQFQHVHPDERFIVWTADTISWPGTPSAGVVQSLFAALNPQTSSLNPLRWPPGTNELAGQRRNYAYGHFPLYLLVIAAHAAQALANWMGNTTIVFPPAFQPIYTVGRHLAEYNYLPLVARALSALADLGTLLLVYALAVRCGDWVLGIRYWGSGITHHAPRTTHHGPRITPYAAGLFAAALYAFAVLPIQLSHFGAVDTVLTFCVTATVALAARRAEGGGWATWLLAGAMAGLAVGSKFSAILVGIPLLVAALYRLPDEPLGRRVRVVAWRLAAAGAAALVVFVITNPFAIIEFKAYVGQILSQNAMVSGAMDAPYTRQYIGSWPYLYFIQQLSQWGLGWPLGLLAWGGLIWALVVAARRKASPALVVMLAWALPYFALTGSFHTKFLRYMAPLLPFLIVFGVGAAMAGYRWLSAHWGGKGRGLWATLAVITMGVTIGWALAFTGIYRQEHPWTQASRWIYANIPDGKKLLTEHWDDSLPLTLDELPGKPPIRTYQRVELPLWDPDTADKLDTLVNELSTADYIVIASNRLYAPMGRLVDRYPMASQYYRMLFAGDLGYRLVAEFTDYPRLGGLTIHDDHADESFTVYDHPRVLVFENAGRLKPELLRARLGRYLPSQARGSSGGLGSGIGQRPPGLARYLAQALSTGTLPAAEASRLMQVEARSNGLTCIGAGFNRLASGIAGRFNALRAGWWPFPQASSFDVASVVASLAAEAGRLTQVEARSNGLVAVAAGFNRLVSGLAGRFNALRAGWWPFPQTPAPGAPLTLSQPVDTLPVVNDFRWNSLASESAPLAVLLWWLVISLFGWLAWPLIFPLLGGLRDRGYGLARAAGWLLIGWVHWIGVSLGWWQNRLAAIALISGVLAVAGLAAGIVQRGRLRAFWAERHCIVLGEEALFTVAFLAFVGVRLLDPDLWQPWNGGEKFMEFAFLNAILRSPFFPPYDPYFAGGFINYYYHGFYLVSLPIKLTGIASEVAFNLAVPSLFALTAVGLFSVASSLASGLGSRGAEESRSGGAKGQRNAGAGKPGGEIGTSAPLHPSTSAPLAGALAVLLALLMGNLSGLGWAFSAWGHLVTGRPLPAYDYWAASRVIPYTINEFPLWTFVFADLHPHLIAMPFGLLVVGLALNWVVSRGTGVRNQGSGARNQGSGIGDMGTGSKEQGTEIGEQGTGNREQGAGNRRALPNPQSSIPNPQSPVPGPRFLVSLSTCLLIVLALGALGAINTWDLPTYALLVTGAFILAGWQMRRWPGAACGLVLAGVILALSVAAYLPFYTHYKAQVGEATGSVIGRFLGWVHAASPLGEWLVIWGFFLLLAVVYVTVAWTRLNRSDEGAGEQGSGGAGEEGGEGAEELGSEETEERGEGEGESSLPDHPLVSAFSLDRRRLIGLLVLLGLLALLAGVGRPTAAIAALPLCLALPLAFRRQSSTGEAFLALLLALGLGIVAGIELVYLRDFLEGGDWYRMNTLFKFSVPAWLFLGLGGGIMLPAVWAALRRTPAWVGVSLRAVLAVLLAGGLIFLVVGVKARVEDRFPGARPAIGTLDGTAYMTVGSYTWPSSAHPIALANERAAIRWLLDHVSGSPVIAEAPAGGYEVGGQQVGYDYYRAGGLRVASLTGFPTFVGQHQYEQRPGDQVSARFEQGKEFFTTTDIARTRQLMADLRVDYVYVGTLERILFAPEALHKFDVMAASGDLEIVYRNPDVTIYRVTRQGE